jgi:hypothetical protein
MSPWITSFPSSPTEVSSVNNIGDTIISLEVRSCPRGSDLVRRRSRWQGSECPRVTVVAPLSLWHMARVWHEPAFFGSSSRCD